MSYVYQLPYLDQSGSAQTNPITSIFSDDGTKMILAGATNLAPNGTGSGVGTNTLYQYTLSTGFDLSTASPVYPNLPSGTSAKPYWSLGSGTLNYRSIVFGDSGDKIFAVGKTSGGTLNIVQLNLSSAYDITGGISEGNVRDVSTLTLDSGNIDEIGGISFLPHSDHTYRQAPYQDIDKETYDMMQKEFPKNIDWEKLADYEKEDNTVGSQEFACVSGSCEIVDL